MPVVTRLLVGGALVATVGLTTAPLAWAGALPCDAYSQKCETPPPVSTGGGAGVTNTGTSSGGGTTAGAGTGAVQGSTLPFTGGEVAGAAAVGLVAVGLGTVLVVGGRRRRTVA